MVERLAGRVEAGSEPVARQAAAIVARIGIVEPVGQQEIGDLVLRQPVAV